MNKIIAMIVSVFMLVVMVGMVSASVGPALTVISGTVYEADLVTPVSGATVTVTCNSNVLSTVSAVDGAYSVTFPVSQCNVGDTVSVQATKGSADGSNTGVVNHLNKCRVNTGLVDVSIPEFGVIAGAIALVGALGIFVYRRKD